MLIAIFVDWLRHHTAQVRRWLDARLGHRLRPLFEARATILLVAGLGAFLGWLAWLWYAQPTV